MKSAEVASLQDPHGEAHAAAEPKTVEGFVAPHAGGAEPVDYRIVIPSRGRHKRACDISSERKLSKETKPFILVKTLAFLKVQGISPSKVDIWTSDEQEAECYRTALRADAYWADTGVDIRVGEPGIRRQRNLIAQSYPERMYLVSLDDDLTDVLWKQHAGSRAKLVSLPPGGFEHLIFHAYSFMTKHKAFIWGAASTIGKNPMSLWIDGISTRNGEINGFLYGFINRHDSCLFPEVEDATEDAERSLRYFAKDKVVLRYRMYCCETRCWKEQGGLQALMGSDAARKEAERRGAEQLQKMFPSQTLSPKESDTQSTLNVKFRHIGGIVLPTTSKVVLTASNELEKQVRKYESDTSKRKRPQGAAKAISEVPRPLQSKPQFQQSSAPVAPSTLPETSADFVQPSGSAEANAGLGLNSDNDDEGERENSQFEEAFAGVNQNFMGHSQSSAHRNLPRLREEDVIRQAMEKTFQELVLEFNGAGSFGDHIQQAIEQSQAEEERERRLERQEREEFIRAKRQSCLELGLDDADSPEPGHPEKRQRASPADEFERSATALGSTSSIPASGSAGSSEDFGSTAASSSRAGPASGSSASSGVAVQRLVDMGFPFADAERQPANARGDLTVAAERLLDDALATSEQSASTPIVIDLD